MDFKHMTTPCYVIDENIFRKNIEDFYAVLNQYFPRNCIGYSFKTNSLPYLLQIVKKLGCYAETVSDMEYELALKLGFPCERIIFNGPIKGKEQFFKALCAGSMINIDSQRELDWLEEWNKNGGEGSIGIRVNFDVENALPGQTAMGNEGGRFGFCVENGELSKAVRRIKVLQGIQITGLHMHISSKSKSQDIYRILTKAFCEIAGSEQLKVEYLDIGGGFFGGNDDGKAYEAYVKTIYEMLKQYHLQNLQLIVEPGASVIATAVDYMTQVLDVKETMRDQFVVTDGSRLHIDPFFHKKQYSYQILTESGERSARQTICGYTCMENDRIMKLENEKKLSIGDRILYRIVGAYTMCFNSLFIQYLPRVYVKKGEEFVLVRDQWGVEEYLQKSIWSDKNEKYIDAECRNKK